MKNLKEVATEIAKREGKKVEARIGEVREILGILCDLCYEADDTFVITDLLYNNGKRRAKRKSKKQ